MSFEITCLECGSNNCTTETMIDYDWDESPYEAGCFIYCRHCGNEQRL